MNFYAMERFANEATTERLNKASLNHQLKQANVKTGLKLGPRFIPALLWRRTIRGGLSKDLA